MTVVVLCSTKRVVLFKYYLNSHPHLYSLMIMTSVTVGLVITPGYAAFN